MQLGSRASKKYSDPNAWHNQFYSLVTTKIDEEIFKPLFPEGKKSGRPNASIRILVAMSVLKEGFGCSDEDLFEKCEFDLLTRKALGMELLTDVTPSIDTYYLFRRRICEYQERTGIDLMQLCFEQLAGKHVHLLKISGKCVRMDSKLIGSNIARQSRYELIHTTLVKFLKTCTLTHLSPEQEERAKEYLKEDSSKTVYRSDSDTLQSNLARIGNFIMEMLAVFPATSPAHDLLLRLFEEQYAVMDGKAVLRDKNEKGSTLLSLTDSLCDEQYLRRMTCSLFRMDLERVLILSPSPSETEYFCREHVSYTDSSLSFRLPFSLFEGQMESMALSIMYASSSVKQTS